ncbi:MAG: hypothetical protein HY892_06870, partial [Deltaproteobacteria bacterium]|nr:hypothetical protein [Deltaproteobacteria bacterium]
WNFRGSSAGSCQVSTNRVPAHPAKDTNPAKKNQAILRRAPVMGISFFT